MKHFGINPTRDQLSVLAEVPFAEETLEECRETHVLVAVFPMSILDVYDKIYNGFSEDAEYKNQAFAKDKGELSWELIKKTPIEDSTDGIYREQLTLLSDKEKVPTAQVMVYTIIGHFFTTGERLFERIYIRCSDMDSRGAHVFIGKFFSSGLYIGSLFDGYSYNDLGLASAEARLEP